MRRNKIDVDNGREKGKGREEKNRILIVGGDGGIEDYLVWEVCERERLSSLLLKKGREILLAY